MNHTMTLCSINNQLFGYIIYYMLHFYASVMHGYSAVQRGIYCFWTLWSFIAGLTGLFCPCVLFGRNVESLRDDTPWNKPCICHAIFVEGGMALAAATAIFHGIEPGTAFLIGEGLLFTWWMCGIYTGLVRQSLQKKYHLKVQFDFSLTCFFCPFSYLSFPFYLVESKSFNPIRCFWKLALFPFWVSISQTKLKSVFHLFLNIRLLPNFNLFLNVKSLFKIIKNERWRERIKVIVWVKAWRGNIMNN